MTSNPVAANQVIIGVDTHKDTHTAVAINGLGARLADCTIAATPAGYEQLLNWAKALGETVVFGVEGTGAYGSGLTRFLQQQGMTVIEVCRPKRQAQRRTPLPSLNQPMDGWKCSAS